MNYRWLAVPVILLAALGAAIYFNQPKIADVKGVDYINVDGDEYLSDDYITPDEEIVGDGPVRDLNVEFPITAADCDKYNPYKRDSCLLLYARMQDDEKGCSAIIDGTTRDDCYATLAIDNKDAAMCGKVKIGYQECMADVAIATSDASLCDKGDYEQQQCFKAFEAKDISLCADGYDRRYCLGAVLDSNLSSCDYIRTNSHFCNYMIALDTLSPSLCNKAGDAADSCFFRVALDSNNAQACENLSETRDSCVAWIAYNTNNKALCYQAGTQAQSCIEDLS
ncbi:MAG TPA: hypothetical protein HA254_01330 [Candidatus Diapherotrites archaeon]|uniref:Uncharacterized protein n=1 Tax=Candidatus Iainarchaeum sp. TaxID=3101447 RepID=A0A7J4IWQ3_9ARCH|nr:hypothetical protein [Candidatus Diapherotrites archaeon]